jgi:hypothetical protein
MQIGELRHMDGLSQDNLRHLLNSKHLFSGYCPTCDEQWKLNELERGEIARGLAKPPVQ